MINQDRSVQEHHRRRRSRSCARSSSAWRVSATYTDPSGSPRRHRERAIERRPEPRQLALRGVLRLGEVVVDRLSDHMRSGDAPTSRPAGQRGGLFAVKVDLRAPHDVWTIHRPLRRQHMVGVWGAGYTGLARRGRTRCRSIPATPAFMLLATSLVMLMTPGARVLLRRPGRPQERAHDHDAELRLAWAGRRSSGSCVGYSLCFSGDVGGVIGNLDHGVPARRDPATLPRPRHASR